MKPRSKNLILAILTVLALIGLAACNTGGGSSDQSDSSVPTIADQAENQCPDVDPHPIGESIAQTYDVSYEQVMSWYCEGYSFDNILIALETSQAVDVTADTLLSMLMEKDWETIWDEVGFTGEQ